MPQTFQHPLQLGIAMGQGIKMIGGFTELLLCPYGPSVLMDGAVRLFGIVTNKAIKVFKFQVISDQS
jgi:hypothetical protein